MPLSALDTADRRFLRCSSLSMADSRSLAPMGPEPPQEVSRYACVVEAGGPAPALGSAAAQYERSEPVAATET